ncbi:MAG: hypothetical protein RLZ64_1393, partial [Pseudomonadota bacterium]
MVSSRSQSVDELFQLHRIRTKQPYTFGQFLGRHRILVQCQPE